MSATGSSVDLMGASVSNPQSDGLDGKLSTLDIVFATLAYAGPLSGATGYITVIIGSGNGLGTPMAFLSLMAILLVFSVGYCQMSKYVPKPGAFYAYITAGLGRSAGLASAIFTLMIYIGVAWSFYPFAGLVSEQFAASFGITGVPWWAYTTVFWGGVGILGYFHINVSAKVLGVLLVAEVVTIAFFDIVVFITGGKEGISLEPFSIQSALSGNVGIAFLFGIALFNGFEATAIYREETRNPNVTIPRATYLVVSFIGIFYAITAWAIICGMGVDNAVELSKADPSNSFFVVAEAVGGKIFVDLLTPLLLTSVFASHLSIQNVAARYVYSLAKDGAFPKFFAVAHSRHKSPHRASLCVSFAAIAGVFVFVLLGMTAVEIYSRYSGVALIGIAIAMGLTSLAALVFFGKKKSAWGNGLATILSPSVAFISLLLVTYLGVTNLGLLTGAEPWVNNALLSFLALIWITGFLYAKWLKAYRPSVYQSIGRSMG